VTDQKGLATLDPDVSRAMAMFGKLQPMKEALGCPNLTDPELQLFAMVCVHTGLDPFTKQIYAIKRGGKVTHQTGIDGYRGTAENTHEYRGSDEATFEECDCGEEDSPKHHPFLARVVVHRSTPEGTIVDQVGVARWHELKPAHTRKDEKAGYEDAMWWRMPYNQLSKCAEANGLRKAFPRILGGVYIHEEMEQANSAPINVTPVAKVQDRVAARRAAAEAPKPDEAVEGEILNESTDEEPAWVNPQSNFEDGENDRMSWQQEEAGQDPVPEPSTGWGAPTATEWGTPSKPAPECPNGHGPMAVSNYGGFWCKTCKAKSK
jgi:phage recombination protein Bet